MQIEKIKIIIISAIIPFFRIVIGLLFIYSSISKYSDLSQFGDVVLKYNIIEEFFVPYLAILLPGVELIIGLMLVAGFRIKSAGFVSAALMVIFIVAISINFYRGENFDCGCFETSWMGIESTIGWPILVRNIIWFALSVIFIFSEDRFSIEAYLKKKYPDLLKKLIV
jgi:uncharacterized membrane protein YphA (DoxX/SURF4 family)